MKKGLNRLLLVAGVLLVLGGMVRGIRSAVLTHTVRSATHEAAEPTATIPLESSCDHELNKRVWYPPRLKTVRPCITVTGWVRKRSAERDGDWHYHLEVDGPHVRNYPDLLNGANVERLKNQLVFELVCMGSARQDSAQGVCDGYVPPDDRNSVPRVGDYVAVHGPLVLDTTHGWMEIHPAQAQVLRAVPDGRKVRRRRK